LALLLGSRPLALAQAPGPMEGPMLGAPAGPAPAASAPGAPAPGAAARGAPAEEMVVAVQIEGNRGISEQKILKHIRTRAGRPYDAETVARDVRELNNTRMFVTVKPLSKPVPGGRLVIFQVVERPILQDVLVIGTTGRWGSPWTQTLHKQLEIKKGDAADPFAVEEGRRKLEEFYQKKGFSKVRVTVLEGNKPGDLKAVYLINEGPKQKVLWIRFVGNQIASGERLKGQIKTHLPYAYIFSGDVDRKQIDEDVERLTAYYRSLGFFRARVGRELEFNEAQDWLVLTFIIDEGPRYKVRNVSFLGNSKYTSEQLAENLKLKGSQFYNQNDMLRDANMLQEKYGSIGYVFADIKAENRFGDEPGQLDLVYNITEGDRYRVGRVNVEIKGENPHTRITTVLNRLSQRPGDIVDIRELRASERRLRASGLFMVDPTKGVQPKIVFTPPESKDKDADEELAGRPKRRTSFYRGPSGDNNPYLPPLPPGERWLDVSLPDGDWGTPEPRPAVGAWQGYRPQGGKVETNPAQNGNWQAYPPAPAPDGPIQPMEAPRIVRGQYTGDVGSLLDPDPRYAPRASTPAMSPTAPAASAWQSGAGSQPAVGYPPNNNVYSAPAATPAPQVPSAQLKWGSQARPVAMQQQPADTYQGQGMGAPLAGQPPAGQPWNGQPAGPVASPSPSNQYPPLQPQPSVGPGPGAAPVADPFGQPRIYNDQPYTNPVGEPLRDLPLFIRTEEAQTGKLMLGVGVNSDAGLVGSIILDEQNFDIARLPRSWDDIRNATAWRGAGQKLRIEAVPGTQVQRYMINFQEPYLGNTDISLGLSAFYFDRIYTEWRENRVGGRISLGYQLTHDLQASVAFRGMNVHLSPYADFGSIPDIAEATGNSGLYGIGVTVAHDTRDNAFLATEGHLISASFEQVVGTFKYPHTEITASQYFKLYEHPDGRSRHVLSLTGTVGFSGSDTPVFERYFAGGFSTLRGFRFRGVSPMETTTSGLKGAVGGNFELLGSVQYLFPITADDMLRGVVFCDTGTIEPSVKDWNENYRVAPGFGLRVVIPALGPAPIALDFAFPVSKQPGDITEVFSFFVGFNR
jgi:outer membrane protein insertion porin family